MMHKTNFPDIVRLQIGCRVMFLNNTIGVVTDVDITREIVRVAFCINGGIVDVEIEPESAHFMINAVPACRIQFSLQNAFALTVHKTQAITLPQTSLYLNDQMFSPGQAYVAISRCQSWNDIQILSLTPNSFLVDERVKKEYTRLEQIANEILPI